MLEELQGNLLLILAFFLILIFYWRNFFFYFSIKSFIWHPGMALLNHYPRRVSELNVYHENATQRVRLLLWVVVLFSKCCLWTKKKVLNSGDQQFHQYQQNKQWWSTIPPISTKLTTISYLKSLNTKKRPWLNYGIGNPVFKWNRLLMLNNKTMRKYDYQQFNSNIWFPIVNYTPTRRVMGILEYPCPSVRSSVPKPCVRN